MSWGTRIAIVYISFVVMIVTLIILCTGENIDLEYKDYYARELKYQDKLEAITNERSLPESIGHEMGEENLGLILPGNWIGKEIKGELHFYRPSDAAMDRKFPMAFDAEGKQKIVRSVFQRGMYKLRMDWQVEGKSYFKEEVINF